MSISLGALAHGFPSAISTRIPGALTHVVNDYGRDATRIEVRLALYASLDLSHESIVRNGEPGLAAALRRITGEVEHLATVSFAPMLAEREEPLVRERDRAIARVIDLQGRLARIAFVAAPDETGLRDIRPDLVEAIEEAQP